MTSHKTKRFAKPKTRKTKEVRETNKFIEQSNVRNYIVHGTKKLVKLISPLKSYSSQNQAARESSWSVSGNQIVCETKIVRDTHRDDYTVQNRSKRDQNCGPGPSASSLRYWTKAIKNKTIYKIYKKKPLKNKRKNGYI